MLRCLPLLFLVLAASVTAQSPVPPSVRELGELLASPPANPGRIREQVLRLFGRERLLRGKAGPRIEGTTVAWAVMDMQPARVVRQDGTLIGDMIRLGDDGLQVLVRPFANFQQFGYRIEVEGMARVAGPVHLEHFEYTADSLRQPDVPQGRLEKFEWRDSRVFPQTVREVTVYLPQQYRPDEPACLMVWQDGSRHADPNGSMRASVVFDNLIAKREMPVTIGVFVDPGRQAGQKPGARPANRSFEYDSLGDAYARFLLTEILPEVQKRYGVKFRPEPEARAIAGGSSGGICAFTAAWERPDQFHKVLCWVGTFVDIRGGNAYPYLLRVTERKPLRVYLQDGTHDLDNKFGNWPLANRMMEASLRYLGYDCRVDWNEGFHGSKGMAPLLPEALRWLWRDVK